MLGLGLCFQIVISKVCNIGLQVIMFRLFVKIQVLYKFVYYYGMIIYLNLVFVECVIVIVGGVRVFWVS